MIWKQADLMKDYERLVEGNELFHIEQKIRDEKVSGYAKYLLGLLFKHEDTGAMFGIIKDVTSRDKYDGFEFLKRIKMVRNQERYYISMFGTTPGVRDDFYYNKVLLMDKDAPESRESGYHFFYKSCEKGSHLENEIVAEEFAKHLTVLKILKEEGRYVPFNDMDNMAAIEMFNIWLDAKSKNEDYRWLTLIDQVMITECYIHNTNDEKSEGDMDADRDE